MPYVKLEDVLDVIKKFNWNLAGLMQHIKEHCPTADVAEVVRCEDCEYYKKSVSALFPNEVAYICDNPYGLKKNPDGKGFCSYGERKEEK